MEYPVGLSTVNCGGVVGFIPRLKARVFSLLFITVILAAVIGTFVLGLGDSLNQGVTAGVSVDQGTNDVTVTLVDKGTVDSVNVTAYDGTGPSDTQTLTSVGESVTVTHNGNNVQVIGVRADGTESVIRTIEVE